MMVVHMMVKLLELIAENNLYLNTLRCVLFKR